MDAFLHDLRLAFRILARRPAFTALAAGALSLGIGATTVLFSVVDGVLLRPLPFEDPETLITVWRVSPGGGRGEVAHADFADWRGAASFSSMAAYHAGTVTVTGLGEPEVLAGAEITPDFFRVFNAPPLLGRGPAPEETVEGGPAIVVVSHVFWESRLASDPDILSRTLDLDGRPHQVVGVAPPDFDFPVGARFWRPLQNPSGCGRQCRYLRVIGRLAGGTPLVRARQELTTLAARRSGARPEEGAVPGVELTPLHETVVGEARPGLMLTLGAVVLVLLIACANVANLLMVRGAGRTAEVAVRAALGAGRGRIVRHVLTESLALAIVAGGTGLLLAAWGLDLVRVTAPPDLPRMSGVGIDGRATVFTGLLVAATALIVGSAPALWLARGSVVGGLAAGGPGGGGGAEPTRRSWGRTGLLVAEVALSLVLLAGAGLVLRSSRELQRLDPGFDPEGVITFGLVLPSSRYPGPTERIGFYRTLEARLAAHPRVEAVGSVVGSPLGPDVLRRAVRRLDGPLPRPGEEPAALIRLATEGYFRTLRIPLLDGRLFRDRDGPEDPRVALVSRAAADRFWPGEDPVGKDVVVGTGSGVPDSVARIVGVVGSTRSLALTEEEPPEIYLPFRQAAEARLTVHVRALPGTGGTDGLGAVVRSRVRALDPDLPLLRMETLEDRVRAVTMRSRFHLTLLSLFAVVAVSLAAVGLYGVVAYLVSRRSREIGIRLAVGAEDAHVVRLVLRDGLGPALLGIGLGLAGSVALGPVLDPLLFRVDPADPATMTVVTGLLLAVVLAASLMPARQATRIPPSDVLRVERRSRGAQGVGAGRAGPTR